MYERINAVQVIHEYLQSIEAAPGGAFPLLCPLREAEFLPAWWYAFFFVNDRPERALELAWESARGRDVRIAGRADVIQQYLNMVVIDELEIALAPLMFGGGRRLFENLRKPGPKFWIDTVLTGPHSTHLGRVRV